MKSPLRRKWQPTLVFVPGKFLGPRSLVGYSPWGHKRVWCDLATEHACPSCSKALPCIVSRESLCLITQDRQRKRAVSHKWPPAPGLPKRPWDSSYGLILSTVCSESQLLSLDCNLWVFCGLKTSQMLYFWPLKFYLFSSLLIYSLSFLSF